MAEPSRIITLTVPLFSTDYARDNREIAEWNRRARPSFASIQDEINRLWDRIDELESDIGGFDAQIGNLQAQINILQGSLTTLIAWQTPLRSNGAPAFQVPIPVGRFDGDEYWDMTAGPGTYRWNLATGEWFSM